MRAYDYVKGMLKELTKVDGVVVLGYNVSKGLLVELYKNEKRIAKLWYNDNIDRFCTQIKAVKRIIAA